jgi:hypothetical protein
MFVRPITTAENAIKLQVPSLIPHLKEEDINDSRYFEEAKNVAVSQNLYNYGRKTMTTEMPRHAIGYAFGRDKTIEAINPAKAIPNVATPPDILARVAVPDLPPKIFGL